MIQYSLIVSHRNALAVVGEYLCISSWMVVGRSGVALVGGLTDWGNRLWVKVMGPACYRYLPREVAWVLSTVTLPYKGTCTKMVVMPLRWRLQGRDIYSVTCTQELRLKRVDKLIRFYPYLHIDHIDDSRYSKKKKKKKQSRHGQPTPRPPNKPMRERR